MISIAPALVVLAGAAPVAVDGATECPTVSAVAERLDALLPPASGEGAAERATLKTDEQALHVVLRAGDGTLIGERAWDRSHGCDDLAAAAALAIAAWHSDVHPEYLPAPTAHLQVRASLPAPVSVSATPRSFELAAGGGAFLSQGGSAPGILLEGGWGRWARGWGVHAKGVLGAARHETLPAGTASWRRIPVAIGVHHRWSADRVRLDLFADAALSRLLATGESFATNRTSGGWEPGVAGGARVGWSFRRVVPWASVSLWGWPGEQKVYQRPAGEAAALPRIELQLAAGLGFCLCGL